MSDKNEKGVPSPLQAIPGSGIQTAKIDWVKKVKESNGTSFFVPDSFKGQWEKIEEMRKDFNTYAQNMAKKEITLNMAVQSFYFELRKHFDNEGVEVWVKEIGLDHMALKDDQFVVNLMNKEGR